MARSLETEGEQRAQVLLKDFEQQIRTWDMVSTSFLSNVILTRAKGVLGSVGYVLKVPPQNIISTNESDVWIENHIGRENNSPSGTITNKHGLLDHFIERLDTLIRK